MFGCHANSHFEACISATAVVWRLTPPNPRFNTDAVSTYYPDQCKGQHTAAQRHWWSLSCPPPITSPTRGFLTSFLCSILLEMWGVQKHITCRILQTKLPVSLPAFFKTQALKTNVIIPSDFCSWLCRRNPGWARSIRPIPQSAPGGGFSYFCFSRHHRGDDKIQEGTLRKVSIHQLHFFPVTVRKKNALKSYLVLFDPIPL